MTGTILAQRPRDPRAAPPGMRLIGGGAFLMGSDRHYPEEAPVRRVRVDAFWIDVAPVTNAMFAAFVRATGHVTGAEIAPDADRYPGADPSLLQPGSLVFERPSTPVGLGDYTRWWRWVIGADWRHPRGPGSSLDGLADHPVVHVDHADAEAYAAWAGKALPTEAEWEYAARGGLEGADYAWGDELEPDGRLMANTWQGRFPHENLALDGYEFTSPVGAFPPNGFGLHDMIGNVWEWTADWYKDRSHGAPANGCCGRPATEADSFAPGLEIGRKVLKGGSHLCAPNYCRRYRPAARHPETVETSTSHIGFRCVTRAAPEPDSASESP